MSRVAASRLIVIFLKGYLYSIPPMVTSHTVQSQLTFSSSSPLDDQTMIIATTICYNIIILIPPLVTSHTHTLKSSHSQDLSFCKSQEQKRQTKQEQIGKIGPRDEGAEWG